jgi:hypothetical protein
VDDTHRDVIERALRVVSEDDRVAAAWLAGSLATGAADAYSDIDLHLLVEDTDQAEVAQEWPELVERIIGPLVLATPIDGVVGGYTLNRDWVHLDLVVHAASDLDAVPAGPMLVLYDPTQALSDRRAGLPEPGEPYFPDDVVDLYLYFLGNLVVTFGRRELVVARGGVQALIDLLVRLMLAERGIHEIGGQKRLNPFLSEEQRTVLESIPGAAATPTEITAAVESITREFVRRGRALASSTHHPWPDRLQRATVAHLRRHLGTDLSAE